MRTGDVDLSDGRLQEPAWRAAQARGRRGVGLLWGGAAVLVLAAAVVLLLSDLRRQADQDVPLIVADDMPLRVRPAVPGGLVVPNQDTEIYPRALQRGGAERRVEVLLPPPESPKPLPRLATPDVPRMAEQPALGAAAPVADNPGHATTSPSPAAVPPPRELAASAATTSPGHTAAPPAREATRSPAPAGAVLVQLAAVTAESAVQPEIARLRSRLAEELGGRALTASRIERDGRSIWRIRAGGFADEAAARAFCDSVRARGFGCLVVTGP